MIKCGVGCLVFNMQYLENCFELGNAVGDESRKDFDIKFPLSNIAYSHTCGIQRELFALQPVPIFFVNDGSQRRSLSCYQNEIIEIIHKFK